MHAGWFELVLWCRRAAGASAATLIFAGALAVAPGCGDGAPAADAGPATDGPSDGDNPGYDHIFEIGACESAHPTLCADGDERHFDRAAFRDLFVDPFGAGPAHDLYPESESGSYVGLAVPQCEDSSTPDPVGPDSDVDPSTWTCPDGSSVIRCTDGTRPIAYYFPAADMDSPRWLLAVSEGGVICASGDDCIGIIAAHIHRNSSVFGGPDQLSHSRRFSAGVMQRGELSSFHRVIVDQCGGARGLGANDSSLPFTHPTTGAVLDVPVHWHGSRIVRAVLDSILRSQAVVPPTQVVFATNSNGSRGAYVEVDGWADFLADHPAGPGRIDVRLFANSLAHSSVDVESCANDPTCTSLLDSYDHAAPHWESIAGAVSAPDSTDLATVCRSTGPGRCEGAPDAPADGAAFDTLAFRPDGREGVQAAIWGIAPDESCLAAHPTEPDACLDAIHTLLYHVTTPTYLALSGFDRTMRSTEQTQHTGVFEGYSLGDYRARAVAIARAMREARPGQRDPVRAPGHGAWVDSSTDHVGPTNNTKLDRTLARENASTISLLQSLRAWLLATTPRTPLCISDGQAADNPPNPMNQTPIDPADCF